MFEKLLIQILNMSFTASFVILAVMAVRLFLQKAPRILSYALWAVVLFRLVCPFSFESTISLLPVNANPIPQEIVYQQTPQINTGIPILNDSVNSVLPTPVLGGSMNPLQGWLAIGTFLWLSGIAVLVIYSIISLRFLKGRLRGAVCENGNVYLAQGLASPFVMGLFRPKIYLPANLIGEEKRYILLHEQTHIKRLDHVVKMVSFAVLCLHWFNPLVWAAFFLCGKDMELSCDEAVIHKLGADVKKDYSFSLLTLATGRRIVGGSPLAFGEGDTKSRIKNVLNYKKPVFWVVIVAVIAVVAVGIGLAVNPKSDRASMQWAKGLQVEDVKKIELVVMPSKADKVYRLFERVEFPDIVALVHESRGTYLDNPSPIAGGSITFYITTKDGTRHSYDNNGNIYLMIDGDYYEGENKWLQSWAYKDGNMPLPMGFATEDSIDIREESIDDFIQADSDFSAATMTEHVNGKDKSTVQLTDATHIRQLRSLLSSGELTGLQSTNDAPNKEDYLHISVQRKEELLHYYVYIEYGKYYIEQPYNGIKEITAEDYTAFVNYLQADTRTTPAAPIVNSYYAGQSSRAFKMLQKSVFQNWVEYDDSGALNASLVNPKWNFDSFTHYDMLDQNMVSTSDQELYYCTFLDDNGKCGYVVAAYQGESLMRIDRSETSILYDLQANIEDITAKLGETGLDFSTAVAMRVRVTDESRNTMREAIRITDGNANQYLYYFDELIGVS